MKVSPWAPSSPWRSAKECDVLRYILRLVMMEVMAVSWRTSRSSGTAEEKSVGFDY